MRKRRIVIKPRFWVILACLMLIGVCLWANSQMTEKTAKPIKCEATEVDTSAPAVEEREYILNIPLSCELQVELYEATQEFGVDYHIMIALIDRESKFQNVIGDSGASYGYCQIQPKWWYGLMTEIGATDLTIPKDNFRTACAIVSKLMKNYGSIEGALVAYNQGHYYGYSTQYSRDVMANAERYRA